MYTKFFGLNEKPFAITPDPRYLFMSERHGEGLAHLVYGVTESGGFIQLTGEVGTGKTTLVRTLLSQLPDKVDVALILNPQLSALEFLIAICEELHIALPQDKGSAKALVDALNWHLLAAHAAGRRTILMIDEAQNLSVEVLEQLRLLTNLETSKQKLLQIILIAQPELRDKLAGNDLRQLAQRVTGRYHLEPLSKDEASRYIDHRLKVAGALSEIFDESAKREVFRLSGGVPRIMNVICDRALLGAYSRDTRKVTRRLVRRATAEVSGQSLTPTVLKWALPVLGIAGLILLLASLWSANREPAADSVEFVSQTVDPLPEETPAGTSQAAVVVPPAGPTAEEFLRNAGDQADVESAMHTLAALWGIRYDPASGTACAQASAQGLSCLYQRGTLNNVRQLGLPAMLTLTGNDGTTYQPVLVSTTDTTGMLAAGEYSSSFPLDDISDLWFGQFLLFWRPPNGVVTELSRGVRNENVRWLRQSLAALDPEYRGQPSTSDLFDEELEQQLKAFQQRHRLQADGLAGAQTQAFIQSLLALEGTPRLSSGR
ncbi:MAG TPA: AAA family ATPase [Woeseiaceae bacterium]|nr:AAA family ATPase [Woeseiaceae bacterium]